MNNKNTNSLTLLGGILVGVGVALPSTNQPLGIFLVLIGWGVVWLGRG